MPLGYELFGDGPEHVIALHDWMSTHRSFDDVRPYLTTERFTYAFHDHRGYGNSRDLRGDHSLLGAVQDVLEVADDLGWRDFHFLGHSMSGMVGQRLSLDAPDRLTSLVLVTPVTAAGMPLDGEARALFEGAVDDDGLWVTVANAVTAGRLGERFLHRKLEQHRATVDRQAFAGLLRMWSENDFSSEMGGLETPTLVLAGAHDFPAFTAETYEASIGRWYKSVRVECIENAGHYPMSEAPPYFAHVVESFLADHVRTSTG